MENHKVEDLIIFIKTNKDTYHEVVMGNDEKSVFSDFLSLIHKGAIGVVKNPSKITLGKWKK